MNKEALAIKVLQYLEQKPLLVKALAILSNNLAKVLVPFSLLDVSSKVYFKDLKADGAKLSFLRNKKSTYLSQANQVQDIYGFVESAECDSLLFSGLYSVGGGTVNIEAARTAEGQWFRRPIDNPCWPDYAPSTISRDMFMGLLWAIWEEQRLDLAEELYEYGITHHWIMGQGDPSRLYFTPGLQATLAEMIHRMGGKDHVLMRNLPQAWPKGLTGYQAHLDALHITLRGDILGYINKSMLASLEEYIRLQPNNALFQAAYHRYVDGDQDIAIDLLLTEKWFPSHRLPMASDRSEQYLFQRDYGEDWFPEATSSKVHSGTDYLFTTHLILKGD